MCGGHLLMTEPVEMIQTNAVPQWHMLDISLDVKNDDAPLSELH